MLPTTLYIHIPWCVQKCPYCDFNSHRAPESIAETTYINKLLSDLDYDIQQFGIREIDAIFIGGGTPSLLSGDAIQTLLSGVANLLPLKPGIEITMEANPGTAEQFRFEAYRKAGVNRLSIGIQSFCQQQLANLGRIHTDQEAHHAIEMARIAGFDNINLDIMYGLPNQSTEQGLADLRQAIKHHPNHISWYQLTLEPNTVFYKKPPTLPNEDICDELEKKGLSLLKDHQYQRYEISAYAKNSMTSSHNLNYWTFGDYFGIGAGAHGKLTMGEQSLVMRTQKKRQPKDYLHTQVESLSQTHTVEHPDLVFEFMLNLTRLQQPIALSLFNKRTGLDTSMLTNGLNLAAEKEFIHLTAKGWQITDLGRRFTNDLQALFLND